MKNIILLFLSDVKVHLEGDKVAVNETIYENIAGNEPTRTTNESAIRHLIKHEFAASPSAFRASSSSHRIPSARKTFKHVRRICRI